MLYHLALAAALAFPGTMIAAIRTKDEDDKAWKYGLIATICFFVIVYAMFHYCMR